MFAYGSNLDEEQMRQRCGNVEVQSTAVLCDHALAFRGWSIRWQGSVATVVPARGGLVPGVIYKLARGALERLDRCEGAPAIYERRAMKVVTPDGKLARVQVYVMRPSPAYAPSVAYATTILRAYERLGFDRAIFIRALAAR